ncbi:hypothetical protein ME763_32030 [Streptomyces murinus]|uniref:hypothetical protein n=1 Tax=Streptomyces murinus TaxID=33900 RepID=UPI000A219D9A|nr:hypothetical protein [Streptomyces murinus]WDO09921.1 hypothetical protein ME763_32030 [Streptomyces murinus]
MTAVAPEPVLTAPEAGDSLTHSICWCNSDIALCGADVTGQEWATDDEDLTCVVCIDFADRPCPRCGR